MRNQPVPTICPNSPCPAHYPATFPAPLANSAVPAGSYYIPAGAPKANPTIANTWTWFAVGSSSYNSLQVDINRRFSHGLSFRGVYTFSKALDDGDSLNATTSANAPALASNPYNFQADWGPATYNATNIGVISAVYELPFGRGKAFANDLSGLANGFVGGWSVTSIVTLQSGFPLNTAAQLQPIKQRRYTQSGESLRNPNFHGPVVTGKPAQWFNPAAFLAAPTKQRILWKPRQGLGQWSRARDVGLFYNQEHRRQRATHDPISSRTLQPAEPGELQYSQSDRLHAYGCFGDGWCNHQYFDDIEAGSIRVEASLVGDGLTTSQARGAP